MTTSASALVVVHQTPDHPAVLLVKDARGWGIPVASACDDLPAQLLKSLFPRGTILTDLPIARKEFVEEGRPVGYAITLSSRGELNPYVESADWLDARWASFEEAFHIGQTSQEEALQWVERALKKHLAI